MNCKDRSLSNNLSDIELIVFDLDGVVYTGNKSVDGAVCTINCLKKKGYAIRYATNASGKTRESISQKLNSLGIDANPSEIYTSADATCLLVEKLVAEGRSKVFVCGAPSLVAGIRAVGADIVDDSFADMVVIGFDVGFSYKKLTTASLALQRGAVFFVANVDASYPVEGGMQHPGCGALVAALQVASGKKPDYMAGKPQTLLLEMICSDIGLSNRQVAMVGDSLESDILMAKQFQAISVLYSKDEVDEGTPDYRIDSLSKLISIFQGVGLKR